MLSKILKYFYEISKIPHQTYKEEKIANYVFKVAKDLGLKCKKDKYNNVYIKKTVDKTKPYTIFHSHLDMVCVKEPDYNIDFDKDGLKLITKKNYLTAYKTSLGADNGIGVAIILAMLTYENYNMEVIFTTDEECTTTGAINFDYSLLNGKNLISLDGFKLNEIITGCASVCDMKLNFKPDFIKCNKKGFLLDISGLKGGHSGEDIHKNIGNVIKIAGKVLTCFKGVQLSSFIAGKQFNFIPNQTIIEFIGSKKTELEQTLVEIKKQYPSIKISFSEKEIGKALSVCQSEKVINLINLLKTGIISKKATAIELSQNLAGINLEKGEIKLSQRGTDKIIEDENIKKIFDLCKLNDFNFSIYDKLNGFCTNKSSELVKDICNISKEKNNIKLKKVVKHISLECAIFQEKLKDTNIVVISPKIEYAHSTRERVYLPSIEQCYLLLKNYLSFYANNKNKIKT